MTVHVCTLFCLQTLHYVCDVCERALLTVMLVFCLLSPSTLDLSSCLSFKRFFVVVVVLWECLQIQTGSKILILLVLVWTLAVLSEP